MCRSVHFSSDRLSSRQALNTFCSPIGKEDVTCPQCPTSGSTVLKSAHGHAAPHGGVIHDGDVVGISQYSPPLPPPRLVRQDLEKLFETIDLAGGRVDVCQVLRERGDEGWCGREMVSLVSKSRAGAD